MKKVCGRSQELRSMPLCLANGAFKPLKGPFHGKRLRGGSISVSERRQKRFDSSVTGTRGEQEFSRVGMIYGRRVRWGSSSKDPHVRFRICVVPSPVLARSPELANIQPLSHHLYTYTATVAQIDICKKRIHTPISEAVADVKWYIYDTNSIWTQPPGTL